MEDCILAKIWNLTVQTWTCVDEGSIETVWQNSMRLGMYDIMIWYNDSTEGVVNVPFSIF